MCNLESVHSKANANSWTSRAREREKGPERKLSLCVKQHGNETHTDAAMCSTLGERVSMEVQNFIEIRNAHEEREHQMSPLEKTVRRRRWIFREFSLQVFSIQFESRSGVDAVERSDRRDNIHAIRSRSSVTHAHTHAHINTQTRGCPGGSFTIQFCVLINC